jgi:hypothetical protein
MLKEQAEWQFGQPQISLNVRSKILSLPKHNPIQMNKLIVLVVCALFSSGTCFASHEQAIGASSLVYRVARLDLEVTVDCESDGKLKSIKVKTPDFTCTVPKADLDGLGDNVDLGSLRFLVSFAVPGQKLTKAHLDSFAISFSCGSITVNEAKGEEIHAYDEVRFEFGKNEYERRLRCASEGDDKNAWRIFQKNTGAQEEELKNDRKTASPKNPWREW